MIVDVHAHVVPRFAIEEASAPGGYLGLSVEDDQLVHPGGYRHELDPTFSDPGAKLREMDDKRIDVCVLSLSPGLFFYGLDREAAIEFTRRANDDLAAVAAGSDRLMGLATLPMQDPDAAARELERAVSELGLRGAQVGTRIGTVPLDDPSFAVLLEAADRLDVPLLLHPYHVESMPVLESLYMANSVGLPMETTVAALRLIHSGVFDRLDRLRFVLVHGGGFLPYQVGRFDHVNAVRDEARGTIPRPPSAYLDRFWMDTITHDDVALRFLADRIGPERVVLGTDLPFDMAEPRPVERAERAGLDPDALGAAALEALGGETT